MKQTQKKQLALLLVLAMVVTYLPFTSAKADASALAWNNAKSNVVVGTRANYTIKGLKKSYKVTYKVGNEDVGKISKKGSFLATGEGKTTVKATIKSGKKVIKTLKKSVKVGTVMTVNSQAQLNKALKNLDLTKIVIKSNKALDLTIPADTYVTDLTVYLPNGDVTNHGTFNSIRIKAIKENTWTEKGKGNKFELLAKKARLVVDSLASVASVSVAQENANITLQVKGEVKTVEIAKVADIKVVGADKTAKIDNIKVSAKADVQIVSENKDAQIKKVEITAPAKVEVAGESTNAIKVEVAKTAEQATVTASVPVKVKTETAKVEVTLEKGAEGSTVVADSKAEVPTIKNETTEKVEVSTDEGKATVEAGGTTNSDTIVTTPETPSTPSTGDNGGSTTPPSGGGSVTPPVAEKDYSVTVNPTAEYTKINDIMQTITVYYTAGKDVLVDKDGFPNIAVKEFKITNPDRTHGMLDDNMNWEKTDTGFKAIFYLHQIMTGDKYGDYTITLEVRDENNKPITGDKTTGTGTATVTVPKPTEPEQPVDPDQPENPDPTPTEPTLDITNVTVATTGAITIGNTEFTSGTAITFDYATTNITDTDTVGVDTVTVNGSTTALTENVDYKVETNTDGTVTVTVKGEVEGTIDFTLKDNTDKVLVAKTIDFKLPSQN